MQEVYEISTTLKCGDIIVNTYNDKETYMSEFMEELVTTVQVNDSGNGGKKEKNKEN